MITICCTSKVLKRTGFRVESTLPEPTTALGNWYVNILYLHRRQILLFVSELSRLAVVTPAKDIKLLDNHLVQSLAVLLDRLGVKHEWIDAEIGQMIDVHYAMTRSKSLLGTMNDFKIQINALLEDLPGSSEVEIESQLSVCPVGPLMYQSPDQVTLDLLRTKYGNN